MIVAGRNRMESPGATHLSRAFEAFKSSLLHIQMPQNSIRPEGIVELMTSIGNCKELEFLDLQDNTFTETGYYINEVPLRWQIHLKIGQT